MNIILFVCLESKIVIKSLSEDSNFDVEDSDSNVKESDSEAEDWDLDAYRRS